MTAASSSLISTILSHYSSEQLQNGFLEHDNTLFFAFRFHWPTLHIKRYNRITFRRKQSIALVLCVAADEDRLILLWIPLKLCTSVPSLMFGLLILRRRGVILWQSHRHRLRHHQAFFNRHDERGRRSSSYYFTSNSVVSSQTLIRDRRHELKLYATRDGTLIKTWILLTIVT